MGCAASATAPASQPVVARSEGPCRVPPEGSRRTCEKVGFTTQIVGSGAAAVFSKTLIYVFSPTPHPASGSAAEPFAVDSHSDSVCQLALERVSDLFLVDKHPGSVPSQLAMLKQKLCWDRFVEHVNVTVVVSDISNRGTHPSPIGLCVRSKYFPRASSLEPLCGNAEEKVVEDVFVAVSEALSELHDLNAAHLNLHAGNVLRVPTDGGGTDDCRYQYLLGDYGWGPLWSALSVTERRGFLKKGLGDGILPPERLNLTPSDLCPRARLEACVAEDVWALGVLLHKLIYGKAPALDLRSLEPDAEGRRPQKGMLCQDDLVFALRSLSGWTVGDRWVWLLSALLNLEPKSRLRGLRAVRDEFCKRTVRRNFLGGTPTIPLFQNLSDIDPWSTLPSNNSLHSDKSNEDAQAVRPENKPRSLHGFQPIATSVLLPDTQQDSQSSSLERSSRSGCAVPSSNSQLQKAGKVRSGSTARHLQLKLSRCVSDDPLLLVRRLSLGKNVESFIDESESIRCVLCGGDVAPLAFSCAQCPEFTTCCACFVEHGEEHDPEHCILSFNVEPSKFGLGSKLGDASGSRKQSEISTKRCDGENDWVLASGDSNLTPALKGLGSPREFTILPPRGNPASAGTHPRPASFSQKARSNHEATPVEEQVVEIGECIVRGCLEEQNPNLELCDLGLITIPLCLLGMFAGQSATSFIHVTTLDLANNAITEIPPKLCQVFSCLTALLAGNNQLTSFPEAVSELVNLQRLELHRNKLTAMPTSIVRLNKLQYCSLDDNDLEAIPDFVWEMPSLETVFLALNPKLKHWPPISALVNALGRVGNLQLGLDNAPSLWNVFRSTVSERCPSLTVVWNKIFPDEILPGRLYLGALRSAQSPEVYEELRIGSVLTVGRGLNPKIQPGMSHFTLDVGDLPGSSIVDRFADCFRFIDDAPALKPDAPGVLVHCWAGMSRSATCVIAYLMQKFHWRLEDAFAHTKARREAIHPNDGFMEQLKAYDRQLFPLGSDPIPTPAPLPEFPE